MPRVDSDVLWTAFKLRHANTLGILYPSPGGLVKFIQGDSAEVPDEANLRDSAVGIAMKEFGIDPSRDNYIALRNAAQREAFTQIEVSG
jgi:hypothetical protein